MSSTTSWFDLPLDLKSNILARINVPNILLKAQKVCSDWYKVCKDPFIWRVIDMSDGLHFDAELPRMRKLSKLAVDRSQGQLVDVVIPSFRTNEVLLYVADRSSQLRRLTILYYDDSIQSLPEALKKFPLLEELNMYSLQFSKEAVEVAGHYCPLLKKLTVSQDEFGWDNNVRVNDEIAIAIGENLHELRHLELVANGISNIGLEVILDGCPHLVDGSLILRMCWCIDLKGDVVKRCSQQIKCLELPYDFSNDDDDDTAIDPCTDDDLMMLMYDDEDYMNAYYDFIIQCEYDDDDTMGYDVDDDDLMGVGYNSDTSFDLVD